VLVPQPEQNTSSQDVPASSSARIVGDHSISRPRASWSFHRWTTASGSARSLLGASLDVESAGANPHGDHYPAAGRRSRSIG
jgi:hypothetical protein